MHSMIDHLWEFPAVVITAGVVLGWARSTGRPAALEGVAEA
ncbi:hypothetical protein [Tessaracoccus coleopterorum]|nr:hypothetical protein [Tessaracoccus coleopterorum]